MVYEKVTKIRLFNLNYLSTLFFISVMVSLNVFTVKLVFLFFSIFFYILNCFIKFDGEVIYTIDFTIIFLIAFYLISSSQKFESSYSFLASNWDNYALSRKKFLISVLAVKNSITIVFSVFATRQLVCLETFAVSRKVLNTNVKANLFSILA